jgi:cyclic nucleotide gated channel
MLKIICAILEPMIYMEGSYIIREGEPLDMMFFVTRGNVLTFKTKTNNGTIELIEKEEDSWYGEELLTWAERSSSKLSTLPISTVTVKAHNKVEVFALKALKALKALNALNLHDVVSKLVAEIIEMESGQYTSSNM